MTLFRMFATLAFSASVLSACGPQDPGSDVSRQFAKTGGYTEENSFTTMGGMIAGQVVTGLFYVTPASSGTTGWWIGIPGNNQYAQVTQIQLNGAPIQTLSSAQGFFQVERTDGVVQQLTGANINLVLTISGALSGKLRIVSSQDADSYGQYVTEWAPLAHPTEWSTFCPHTYASSDGTNMKPEFVIPVAGAYWQANGVRVPNGNAIQLSCTHDSVGGCIRWGYEPWAAVSYMSGTPAKLTTTSLQAAHQACTRMKRADFCGNGQSFTTVSEGDGAGQHTVIQLWDRYGIHRPEAQTGDSMEAHWDESGATCLNRSKFRSDNETYGAHLDDDILRGCSLPDCTTSDTAAAGALVSSGRPYYLDEAPSSDSTN